MQDFNFAQIWNNLAQISPKFAKSAQIFPKFFPKNFLRDADASAVPTALWSDIIPNLLKW